MTGAAASTPSGQQIARMERDLAALQTQVKSARKLTASTICILPSHADTLPSCSPTLASFGGFRITAQNVLGSFRKSLRSKRSALSRRPRRRKIPYGAETWPIGITKRSRLVRQDRIMYRLEATAWDFGSRRSMTWGRSVVRADGQLRSPSIGRVVHWHFQWQINRTI